jgi:AcrR family transcriptional regulator
MRPNRVILSREKLATAIGDRWSEAELDVAVAALARADGRFPPGVSNMPAALVKAIQRERLIAAMTRAVAEVGYNALTVEDVLARAGTSRPTFYEQFEGKEDCFLAAFDASAAQLWARIDTVVSNAGGNWRERLRSGIAELLRFVEDEPAAARALIVEARASSADSLRRRDELLDRFAACIDAVVREDLDEPPSAVAAAGVVGGIESVLYARLQKADAEPPDELLPSLMYFVILAYAGHEAADDELDDAALA